MAKWLVELEGNDADLDEFVVWFPTGDTLAHREDGRVYLCSTRFASAADAPEANALALTMLEELGAIISIMWPPFIYPKIKYVIYESNDGMRHTHHVLAAANLTSRSKLRAVPNGDKATGPTRAQLFLDASKASVNLTTALLLWVSPNQSWARLYRILEELELHCRTPLHLIGHCIKSERDRFRRSANTPLVAGLEARHAGDKLDPPAKPMTLNDATSFVRQMIEKCLSDEASGIGE